jgi:hypothetical protein
MSLLVKRGQMMRTNVGGGVVLDRPSRVHASRLRRLLWVLVLAARQGAREPAEARSSDMGSKSVAASGTQPKDFIGVFLLRYQVSEVCLLLPSVCYCTRDAEAAFPTQFVSLLPLRANSSYNVQALTRQLRLP